MSSSWARVRGICLAFAVLSCALLPCCTGEASINSRAICSPVEREQSQRQERRRRAAEHGDCPASLSANGGGVQGSSALAVVAGGLSGLASREETVWEMVLTPGRWRVM